MKYHVHFARKSGWTSSLVHPDFYANITSVKDLVTFDPDIIVKKLKNLVLQKKKANPQLIDSFSIYFGSLHELHNSHEAIP